MAFILANINWPIIVIVGIAVLALLIFINRRNQKDEKDMEETMNQVDTKPLEHDNDNDSKS